MANEKDNDYMIVKFVTSGDPDRIPAIGTILDLPCTAWKFKVESYGESRQIPKDDPRLVGFNVTCETVYELELNGCLVLPKGSPMAALEDLLNGRF